jgi:protease I
MLFSRIAKGACAALLTLALMPVAAGAQGDSLEGKHVAFLVGEGVHDGETLMPMAYLVNRGAKVTIIGVEPGTVTAYNSAFQFKVQESVANVSFDTFDALVIPGGRSPAFLREHENVVDFVRGYFETGKPVAAICHGPQVLVTAGLLEGYRATAIETIRDELTGAGADYVDEEVVIDRNLITSRLPPDLPAFSVRLVESLAN